ncbi:MAG TPA: SMP-30/gluconolactonase/LRE family protein, partial [Gemmatimonadales bacterium]
CEGKGETVALSPSGYTGAAPFAGKEPGSNGLAFDATGRLVMAEHGDRRISRLEPDGRKTTLADRWNGRRLNSPNDLVYDGQGNLIFTDPPWGLPGWWDDPAMELGFSGVYRLSPQGELTLLSRELEAPNGLALSPDGRSLVVTESKPGRFAWYVFDVRADRSLAGPRLLRDAAPWATARPGAPDGLEFDREGHLFAAGPGGVYVLTLDGTLLGVIETGRATSNVTWGGDGSDLYITAGSVIYRLRTTTSGALP